MVTNLGQFERVPSGTSARKPQSVPKFATDAKCCDGLSRLRAHTVTTTGPGPQRQLSLRAGADRGKHRRGVVTVCDAYEHKPSRRLDLDRNAQSLRGSSLGVRRLGHPPRRLLGGGGGDREWLGTWDRRTLRGCDGGEGCPR